jgi:hypothetical protein
MSKGATAQELFIICNQDDTQEVIAILKTTINQAIS